MKDQNTSSLLLIPAGLVGLRVYDVYADIGSIDKILLVVVGILILVFLGMIVFYFRSAWSKANRKRREKVKEVPLDLLLPHPDAVLMGRDIDLDERIFLPDKVRTRHVHILGATGSGKTESVILNFIRQDVERGLGSIILDAKGDASFLSELQSWVPADRLRTFDLTDTKSLGYDPLAAGSPLEAAQRLFSSLTWSEEYYKSKALSALQCIFERYYELNERNPKLSEIAGFLETQSKFTTFVNSPENPRSVTTQDFQDLSGLRDQVRSLMLGHLKEILSPMGNLGINLAEAGSGTVIYFRLQSLISPQIVATVGKLVINHLNFLAGTAHRERIEDKGQAKPRKLVPIYLDEFATFACPEFADLISKARSAGFALHFSHQSISDVLEVSPGFLGRITDNSATKIVMRINDPDSAEFLARCFGTKEIQKTTQRITNSRDIESAEIVGEGTTRDAHQFRVSPDLLKTLPTGMGAVLVAHGHDSPIGASTVFKIRFPAVRIPCSS